MILVVNHVWLQWKWREEDRLKIYSGDKLTRFGNELDVGQEASEVNPVSGLGNNNSNMYCVKYI